MLLFTIYHLPFTIYCLAQEQFVYDAKGRRNPFIPLVTADGRFLALDKTEEKDDLSIEGIIYDKEGRSFAIINGTVVGVSDKVAGYQVLKIEENKVFLIKDGQVREAGMKKEGK
jgi:hypothetical protein